MLNDSENHMIMSIAIINPCRSRADHDDLFQNRLTVIAKLKLNVTSSNIRQTIRMRFQKSNPRACEASQVCVA
ncbi:2-succinyl-6-hydroxy-2,4-cyclohexadiene-1-carboxylate synthase [Fusarium oxysporum f. sp. albedinis]|nr:2-succinyl-6-hydroxy-2,4-cyclohexadiene-1-carboxylate synthase [Fusarium oxysporum f. sp. albedinis]